MDILPMYARPVQIPTWSPYLDPEYAVLRIFLGAAGYSQHAQEVICDYAEREGTLEGLVEAGYLEPVDMEGAEAALVAGMDEVPMWSARWDDPDRWSLTMTPEHYEPTAQELADFGSYLDSLTDEQIDALARECEVDPDDLVGLGELHDELTAPLDLVLPPLSGGSPEADLYEPTAEDLADMAAAVLADDRARAARRDADLAHEARYRRR